MKKKIEPLQYSNMDNRFFIKAEEQHINLFTHLMPVGTLIDFWHSIATDKFYIKLGYLPCDGRKYDPKKYPELKKFLKDAYGPNKVPNMKEYSAKIKRLKKKGKA